MCLRPTIARGTRASTPILIVRLAMFLARSPTRSRSPATRIAPIDLAQVHRHRLAPGDGHDRQLLDLALQRVETRIGGDDLMGERRVGVGERVHGVDHHFLGDAAHFGDAALERVELLVVGLDGMFDHGVHSLAEPAGDVILGALVARRGEDRVRLVELDHSPRYMKAVNCETRAACCMLWVTMAIVYSPDSSSISSSILAVEIGSSAEQGSSNRITSGLIATVRAMHRRCCWPPERLRPLAFSLSFTSFHSADRLSDDSTRPSISRLGQLFVEADAEGDVVVDRHRERRRLLEHHADPGAQQIEVQVRRQNVLAVEQDFAFGALAGIEVVHAVEDAQQRRLAAARRTDEGGDLAFDKR